MFDVPQAPQNTGLGAIGQLATATPVNLKGNPVTIMKAENGFLAELQYMNVRRVYTDIDALCADLKTYFSE